MKRTKDDSKEDAAADPAAVSSSNGTDAPPSSAGGSATAAAAAAAASVRTTGRVKKPRQVYDPSDNYVPRSSNRNSLGGGAGTGTGGATPTGLTNINIVKSPPANVPAAIDANDSLDSIPSPALPEKEKEKEKDKEKEKEKDKDKDKEKEKQTQSRNFDTCQKCKKSEPKRGSGHKSNFLTCKSCTQKWHFPCLAVNFDNLSLARKKYKCEKCRYCTVCSIRGRDLPICSSCAEAYHLHCNDRTLKPNVKLTEIDPKWKCFRCKGANNNNNTTIIKINPGHNTSSSGGEQPSPVVVAKSKPGRKKRVQSDPPDYKKPAKMEKLEKAEKVVKAEKPVKLEKLEKLSSPLKPKQEEQEEEENNNKENAEETSDPDNHVGIKIKLEEEPLDIIEELEEEQPSTSAALRLAPTADLTTEDVQKQPVSTWTVEQVVQFIAKYYPQEANVFGYQDIDGASLLLLTRQDVMNRFGLKLGPALRVYELVLSLQSQSDDVTVAWLE